MNLTERLAAAEAEIAAIKKELEAEQVGSLLPADWGRDHFVSVPNKDYGEALCPLIELRQQPGSEAAKRGMEQWIVGYAQDDKVVFDYWVNIESKISGISPCFRTKEHAAAAIKAVGADRIKRMFQVLHGVE
jgi:hypothetical protein